MKGVAGRTEVADGLGIGSDRDGGADLLGSAGRRIWIERGMAVAARRPRDRGSFSQYQKRRRLDHNDPWGLDPGCEILLHSVFDPPSHQDLFLAGPSDRPWPSLALEV